MTTYSRHASPKRLAISDMPDGSRRVVLGCACCRVARSIASWEGLPEVIDLLVQDHERASPSCPHPYLPAAHWASR
jgi:hypothetical protein